MLLFVLNKGRAAHFFIQTSPILSKLAFTTLTVGQHLFVKACDHMYCKTLDISHMYVNNIIDVASFSNKAAQRIFFI